MKIFKTGNELSNYYTSQRHQHPGFVPTMGALHPGHLSLVATAKERCDTVAVSIFVNPTQFNDPEDLKKYPRTLDDDLKLLRSVLDENDFVFVPEVKEIYPVPDTRVFDFGNLERVMEGIHRPGHFNGVAQVVSRLFELIDPSVAFFGQKDFQQLAIIKELAVRLFPAVEIVSCPIVRENDGLAMSSRNVRLLPEHRKNAGIIFKTLGRAAAMAKTSSVRELQDYVISEINKTPGFRTEYFEIVEERTLKPLSSRKEILQNTRYFGCIALFAGEIRLIDNMEFRLV